MHTNALSFLASFISNHSEAWKAFIALVEDNIEVRDFTHSQDNGCYVLRDSDGNLYYFRMYRDIVVGILSERGNIILVGHEYISAPRA